MVGQKLVTIYITCKGHFVNPITDVCWGCLLPVSIGGFEIGKGVKPKKRDIKNPTSPVCACSKLGQPIPIPGISIGFWEPVRLVDVTRTPYCMVNLGGIALGNDAKKISSFMLEVMINVLLTLASIIYIIMSIH